jgi:hypothetical protein
MSKHFLTAVPWVGVQLSVYLVILNAFLALCSWPFANALAALAVMLTGKNSWRANRHVGNDLTIREILGLVLGAVVVGSYCLSWFWQRVPYDFWLDFPQQSLIYQNGLDLSHPFIAGLSLGGQYGRNLLVAGLSRISTLDLITTCIVSTVLVQVVLFCQVFLVFRVRSTATGFAAAAILFLGLGVGGWCGFLDHFFHHASLAHALLFVAWSQMKQRSIWASWPLLALGIVYPLFVCLLAVCWLPGRGYTKRSAAFVLGLLMLLPMQGGPLRQLVDRREGLPTAVASQHQSFSVVFPKERLFCINFQPWKYWRLSLGLSSLPSLASLPDYQEPRYTSVFSLEVLALHWLPLWLAPLSLFFTPSEGKRWWLFGAVAYLTPALVDFGPVYEAEYYRWELAAAIGFGSSLALSLPPRRWIWLVVALCCWPGVYRLSTMPWCLAWPSEQAWLTHHRQNLRLRKGEIEALKWLSSAKAPGESLWRDALPDLDDNSSMNGDAVAVGLSGLKMTGRAYPLPEDFIGRPPFRPTQNARAFWVLKDPAAVKKDNVTWLLANRQQDYSGVADLRFHDQEVSLWKVDPTKKLKESSPQAPADPPPKSLWVYVNDVFLYKAWCPKFEGTLTGTWVRNDELSPGISQQVHQSRRDGLILSTPTQPGLYTLELSSGQSVSIEVRPTAHLGQLLVSSQSRPDGTLEVLLKNPAEGELRLHNLKLSLLAKEAAGAYRPPLAVFFQEVFVINADSEASVVMSPSGALPQRCDLNLESREGSRLLPLPRL